MKTKILTIPSQGQKRLIVGDVHGHYEGLLHVLKLAGVTRRDQVFFLGDLIDRGPDSKGVLQFVRSHDYPTLMGNHEELLLDALNGVNVALWLQNGGYATVEQYGGYKLGLDALNAHRNWLEALPHLIDLGDVLLVHAGLNPDYGLEEQSTRDLMWLRDEFLYHPQPYFKDKMVLCGHTLTFTLRGLEGTIPVGNVAKGPGWLGLETGAFHSKSGWLTCLDWDNQQVYQVDVLTGAELVRTLADAVTDVCLDHG